MKTNKIIIAFAALSLMVSCQSLKEEFQPVFTGKYEAPDKVAPVKMTATHTIKELVAKYSTGKPFVVEENIVIAGKVSTTDQPGNFYKSFYIQDETGGIEIKIGKNALYNDYLPGQTIYVDCNGLTVGQYGYKSGSNYGNGMVQVGYSDPTGEYETSYLETPLLIDAHVFKGEMGSPVEPIVLEASQLPASTASQATNPYVGKLVTIKDLTFGWKDSYGVNQTSFALLYIDSNKDKKASSNRIFVSSSAEQSVIIPTWAMSKAKMTELLTSGAWDSLYIGNGNDYNYGTVGDMKGDGTYPGIEKAAASVSHYFKASNGQCVQIRTSGFSKFADTPVDPGVFNGTKKVTVTGILALYQGQIQMVVNNIDDIKIQ